MRDLRAVAKRALAAAQARDSIANRNFVVVAAALLALWLAAVLIIEGSHEFWRDEVRAWSLARAAASPLDLPGLLRTEGHPVLWYVLLWIGKSIVDTPLVLPIVSVSVAFAAMVVLMFASPFPIWMKCLFMFGALPLYEYSVMARNYGISMLLLFVAAALYRRRKSGSLWLAVALALLANTNVHSTLLVCLIAAVWTWDAVAALERRSPWSLLRSMGLPLMIAGAGVALSAAVAMPPRDSIVTPVYSLGPVDYLARLVDVIVRPEGYFLEILPVLLPLTIAGLMLYLPSAGLVYRPNLLLAGLGAQIGLGLFFNVAYPGFYKHQGLLLLFLMFLYWIALDAGGPAAAGKWRRRLFHAGYVALAILLISGNLLRMQALSIDTRLDVSAGKAFGAFLNGSETYRDAIIVPEPDYLLESLPYYAKNEIYLPREHRFGTTILFTEASDSRLSLGALLRAARDLQSRYGRPVLIVFGHPDVPWDGTRQAAGEIDYSYNKSLSWTAGDLQDAARSLTLVAEFDSAGDERYRVYAIR